MGNKQSGSGPLDDYDSSLDGVHGPLFVVNFISCSDVPSDILSQTAEFLLSENKIYLRSCIARNIGSKQNPYFERISNIVTTPSKSYTSTSIWNSYRDFTVNTEGIGYSNSNRFGDGSSNNNSNNNNNNSSSNNSGSNNAAFSRADSVTTNINIDSLNSSRDNNTNKDIISSLSSVGGDKTLSKANPTTSTSSTATSSTEAVNFDNCFLSIEVVSKVGFEELGDVIGSVNISIRKLTDESIKTFPLRHHKIGNKERFPKFTITLRRILIDRELPPAIRTIFLLRHGESKWNKAQASRDIKGMLDFDHSLTLEGVAQAAYLNEKWKRESDRLKQEYEVSCSPTNDGASFAADRLSSVSPNFISDGSGIGIGGIGTITNADIGSSSSNSNSSNVLPIIAEDSKSTSNSNTSSDLLNLEESSYFELPAATAAINSLNLLDNPSSTTTTTTATNNINFPSGNVANLLDSDSDSGTGTCSSCMAENSAKLLGMHGTNDIDIFNIEDAHHIEENDDDDDDDYEDEEEEGVDTTSSEYCEFKDRQHQSIIQDNNTSSPIAVNNLLNFLDDKNDSVVIGGETNNKDSKGSNNNNSSSNNNFDLLDLDYNSSSLSTSSNTNISTNTNFTPVESFFVAHDAVQLKKVITVSAVAVNNPSGKTVVISAVHEGTSRNSNASTNANNNNHSSNSSSSKASNGDGDIGEFRDATMMNTRDLYIDSTHEKDDLVMQFRRDEFIRKFLSVKKVYCSPLTRALETAVVGLEGHPALSLNGISLYSVIREIKGIGGVDTVGKAYGDKIIQRLIQELTEKVGLVRMRQLLKTNSAFNAVKDNLMSGDSFGVASTTTFENMSSADANPLESNRNYRVYQNSLVLELNDANYSWWTPASSFDNEQDTEDRIKDFLYFCRYSDESMEDLIFVGHSLFFKHLYSHRISKMLRKNRPELASMMKKHRLANGSVLALTLYFPNKNFCSNASNSSSNSGSNSNNNNNNSSSSSSSSGSNAAFSRADSVTTNISIDSLNSSRDNNTNKDITSSLSQRALLKEADLDPISPDPKTSSTTAGSKPDTNVSGQFDRGEAIIVDADLLFGGDFAEARRARPSSVKLISSRKTNSMRVGKTDGNNTSSSNSKPAATEYQSSSNNNAKSQNTASTLTENFMSGIGSLTKKIHGWM